MGLFSFSPEELAQEVFQTLSNQDSALHVVTVENYYPKRVVSATEILLQMMQDYGYEIINIQFTGTSHTTTANAYITYR